MRFDTTPHKFQLRGILKSWFPRNRQQRSFECGETLNHGFPAMDAILRGILKSWFPRKIGVLRGNHTHYVCWLRDPRSPHPHQHPRSSKRRPPPPARPPRNRDGGMLA